MSETKPQSTFQAPEVEEVARLFPSYEIHALIACGGMGAVYQATQRSLDRTVAIKILPREFSTDDAFRAGFESEAKAMAKLNHPNLIGVYDFGEAGGMLYIVMEYVAGKSLFHSAHGFAVDQSEALPIVIGVCRGLANAHDNGVLHRDIKPSNILLDAQANPKIGDFGLARALERQIEEGEQIFGTPGYTAPEVLQPPFTIDQRADIYSVGVMLHEILTGKLPDADPRSASQISGCSRQIDAIIYRAIHPDPNFRYISVSEMANDLDKISNSQPRSLLTSPKPPAGRALATPGKALQARAAITAAKPAAPQLALGKPKALSRRPALGESPKPSALSGRPTGNVKVNESSALPWILVFLLVAVVIITVLIFNRKPAAAPESPPPPPQAPAIPGKPKPPEDDGKASADPAVVLRSARSSISHRVEPLMETHKRDIKANFGAFEAAFRALPAVRFESGVGELISGWVSDGNRIPAALPGSFANAEGAGALLNEFLGKQNALDDRLEADLKSQSGIYVLELQNQIEQLSKAGEQASVDVLEEEVRRVEADPGYFRSAMQR
jgi:serine/threonine protein kinase